MNRLGNYFQDQRIAKGLSLGQLARLAGYRNVSKGANKIVRFEREGVVTEELLARLAEVLTIDFPTVEALMEQDRTEYLRGWEEWVKKPVPMQQIVRYMPGVYGTKPLPPEITTPEQAEAFARDFAKEHGWRCCLALSRRHSVWIGKDGETESRTEVKPGESNVPWMRLKGSGRKFLWEFGK